MFSISVRLASSSDWAAVRPDTPGVSTTSPQTSLTLDKQPGRGVLAVLGCSRLQQPFASRAERAGKHPVITAITRCNAFQFILGTEKAGIYKQTQVHGCSG